MRTRSLSDEDRQVIHQIEQAQALLDGGNEQGLRDLEDLARAGHGSAMIALGLAYEMEPFVNPEIAERWYRSAYSVYGTQRTEGGNLFLGYFLYRRGLHTEAKKIFSEGARLGYPICMYLLASLLLEEKDRWTDNRTEIREVLERASRHNYPLADRALAIMLLKGKYGIVMIPLGLIKYIASAISTVRIAANDAKDPRIMDLRDFGPRHKYYWRQY